MARITNPNDIVAEYVSDNQGTLGENLVSVFMYGAAVTHEYRPRQSLIHTCIVLNDASIDKLEPIVPVQKKWSRRGMATPVYRPVAFFASSLDTYPVEILDMQSNYRVLYGTDVLKDIQIRKEPLRLQCERELKQISLELRTGFVVAAGDIREMETLLLQVVERLAPVLRALLVLNGLAVPNITSDMIGNVEDLYGLGLSVFAEVFGAAELAVTRENARRLCAELVVAVETISSELGRIVGG